MFSNKSKTSDHSDFLRKVVVESLKNLRILEQHSIYVLRTLNLILNKHGHILTSELSFQVIKCMHYIALSPLTSFKQYTHSITKICLNFLTIKQKEVLCDYNIIPVRGVETYNLMNMFSKSYLDIHIDEIVNKVLCSFKTNIENKDGSILYEGLLIFNFEEWKLRIWPLFLPHLRNIDQEGEFFQSLLKYWIPISVNAYKQDFYLFVRDQQVHMLLKGYILLETRKKGFVNFDVTEDIWKLFHNLETVNLSIRIISTYHKKSLCPKDTEINLVLRFLSCNDKTVLDDECIKSLNMFFSQLFIYAHSDLQASEENFEYYRKTVDKFYQLCCNSLKTDNSELGMQVSQIILGVLKGCHKKLLLTYKIEKKDYYGECANALFQKLKAEKCMKFDSSEFQIRLKHCILMERGDSKYSTSLILSHYPSVCFFDTETFREILSRFMKASCLKSIEKIMNLSRILLNNRSNCNIAFVNEIVDVMLKDMGDFEKNSTFSNILLLTVVTVAAQNSFKINNFAMLLEQCFEYILFFIRQNVASNVTHQSLKVYETFINTVANLTTQNLNMLWPTLNKSFITYTLIEIIGTSNMKKPVTISADALKHVFVKMEECGNDRTDKILLADNVLRCLSRDPKRADLKIRRYPECRLVLHALCLADRNPNKPYLNWIIQVLIQIIKNDQSSDIAVSRSLHCIEILISENTLHSHTLTYVEEIIILCIERFRSKNWIIRNADLQLAKALIDRFFGVSLSSYNRPKTIEDLFILFPNLPTYFFKILSMDPLDERATMAFQFFLESQIKQSLWKHVTAECLRYFRVLFSDVIRNYSDHFGKLAVKSLVALTNVDDIPNVISDVCGYIKKQFMNACSNIISNLVFLVKELYEKSRKEDIDNKTIEECLYDLLKFLRKRNSSLFDFMLVKLDGPSDVLNKMKYCNTNVYHNRIWLNNYIPLVVNSKNYSQNIDVLLTCSLPVCQKVKVLSILVLKFEKGCLTEADVRAILKILIENCLLEEDSYLSVCYYKVISMLISKFQVDVNIDARINVPKHFSRLYQAQVSVLYNYLCKENVFDEFHSASTIQLYLNHIGLTEDIDSDIAFCLRYFPVDISNDLKFQLYKIAFYYSLRHSTCLEIHNFITYKTLKQCHSLLNALECFLSQSFVDTNLGEYADRFYCDIKRYARELCENGGRREGGFYEVESDIIVPLHFLAKLSGTNDVYC
nr:unnamed protein product [Callosobruchus chinensis]